MPYTYRRSITIDHTKVSSSDQTNFPVGIIGTYTYLKTVANGGNVENANGYDIIFTSDAAGVTQLSHEIDLYTATTGAVVFWVKVPTVSTSSDTVIYMWYGNSGISTSQENVADVWSNGYVSVWHLGDGSTVDLNDSLGNNNLTAGGTATAKEGKLGGAANTGDSSRYFYKSSPSSLPTGTGARTLECWAYRDVVGEAWLIATEDAATYSLYIYPNGHKVATYGTYSGGWKYVYNTYDTAYQDWFHIASVFPSGGDWADILHYYNGASLGAVSLSGVVGAYPGSGSYTTLALGRQNSFAGNFWYSRLDEVRISNVERSADWMATQYNNQNSPSTFYTMGGEITPLSFSSGAEALNSWSDDFTILRNELVRSFTADDALDNWSDTLELFVPGLSKAEITEAMTTLSDEAPQAFEEYNVIVADSLNNWSELLGVASPMQLSFADSMATVSDGSGVILGYLVSETDSLRVRVRDYLDIGYSLDFDEYATARRTLLYSTGLISERSGWFHDVYTPTIVTHYGEEGDGVHAILCGGSDGRVYQLTGSTDEGQAISCQIRTPSRDQGDLRYHKLYGDAMLDCVTNNAAVVVTPGFDNHTTTTPAVMVTAASRTQVPIPFTTGWQTARNISLDIAWSHTGESPEYFYTWEPRFTDEGGKLYAYTWSTSYITHDLEGYFYHGYLYLVHISPADLTFSIIAEDGTTAASIAVTASGTDHHKDFLRLPVVKGKTFKYKLSSATQFRVEGQESELLIKQWGSGGGWRHVRIFHDLPIGETT